MYKHIIEDEDLEKKLIFAIDNYEDCLPIISRGQEIALEKYTVEKNALEIFNLYNRLLEEDINE